MGNKLFFLHYPPPPKKIAKSAPAGTIDDITSSNLISTLYWYYSQLTFCQVS